jgi:hypothetical protein
MILKNALFLAALALSAGAQATTLDSYVSYSSVARARHSIDRPRGRRFGQSGGVLPRTK